MTAPIIYHRKLARALDRQGGLWSISDILERIADGRMQGFVQNNSWIVTQISIFPRRRMLEVVAAVGDLGDCRILHDEIIAFADKMNVDLVSAYGRLGWLRDARRNGWKIKTTSYLYHKELYGVAMGGQTGTQQQQTQQTTQLPPWINDAAQQNYALAQNIAARPLQQYQGQMVPDVSQQLQQSWNTAATAGNAGVPQYNAATAGFAGALGQTPANVTAGQISNTNLQPYMDPYTQSVINTSLPIMQQQLGQTLATNAGNAVNQNAFGGSRFGVQQGVAQAQGALGEANMAAGLNQANFTQAQAAATGDINRNLTAQQANQQAQQAKINSDIAASQGLNTAGQGMVQQAQNAFGMQNTAGSQQMSTAQDQINAQMAKFQQAWGYPTQQLGVVQSALGMTPYGQSQTGVSDTQTYTPTDWAALAGSGLGMLGNIFGGKSDIRLKKNLKRVGTHAPTGVPVYDFNWKGQPPGAPKTRGPMAQDIEKVLPGAVAQHPVTGVKHVHPVVLGALSQPGPSGLRGGVGNPLTPMMRTQHRRRVRPPQIAGALSA